jgi:predicted exporter
MALRLILICLLILLIVLFTSFLQLLLLAAAGIGISSGSLRFLITFPCRGDGLAVTGINILSLSIVRWLVSRAWVRSRVLLRGRSVMRSLIIRVICR